MSTRPGVSPGYWWVARADGAGRQIVRVSEDDRDDTAHIVEFIGAGFSSLAKARSKGFQFEQRAPCPEEAK